MVSLSPELTEAPTRADEPTGVLDAAATQANRPASPNRRWAAAVEPDLPPSQVTRVAETPDPIRPTASASASLQFQAALDGARIGAGTYGATFAVVRDGQVVWAGSSGVERDGRTLLTPGSPMVIGSVTKTFVAATVLELVDEGKLSLDDSARRFLPEVRQVSREITIRQLLDHTSGLADVFNDATRRGLEEHPERAWSTRQVLGDPPCPVVPAGRGLGLRQHELLPARHDRRARDRIDVSSRRSSDGSSIRSTSARRESLSPDDPSSPLAPAWTTIFWASGAMSSSAGDLARWGDALYDDDVPQHVLLDGDTARAMFRFNRDDYGLGVKRFPELAPRNAYGHTGLLNTYTTLLLHLPREDITIAMLVNRTNVDLLGMLRQRPAWGGPSLLRLAIDS